MTRWTLVIAATALSAVAIADEGKWTLDNFPRQAVMQKYNAQIGDDRLQRPLPDRKRYRC